MVSSTDSDLSYVYLQYKSEKVYGLFGLGWKKQEHTVMWHHSVTINSTLTFSDLGNSSILESTAGMETKSLASGSRKSSSAISNR